MHKILKGMKYAIIAAGEGSRLAAEGVTVPKPLVEICGERLVDRLIRIFMQNDAEDIVVICNDRTAQVASHLAALQRDGLRGRPVPLRFVAKCTPGSMHSFFEISHWLGERKFVLTTVDTIFREDEFAAYAEAFRQADAGLFPVTGYVEDEKPLYVETNEHLDILGFHDDCRQSRYVSAGIYGLEPVALQTLRRCRERGEHRMRDFQRALVADGVPLKAFPFSKVLDIDHAADILQAERFLASSLS